MKQKLEAMWWILMGRAVMFNIKVRVNELGSISYDPNAGNQILFTGGCDL